MKIVVLTTGHRPDDDRVYHKEVVSLLRRYPRIDLVAPVEPGENPSLAPGVVLHALTRRGGAWGRFRTALQAARVAIRLRPDVCHYHDLDFVPLAPFVRWLTRARLVYDVHEVYPERMLISNKIPRWSRSLAARLVDYFEIAFSRGCALIVAAVDPIADRFRGAGLAAVTLFNYPRLALFGETAPRLPEGEGGYAGRRVLLYQGTMGRDRGLFHMLDGMRLLKAEEPDALLLLVGLNDPEMRRQADEQIRRDGLEGHVRIIPWVEHTQMPAYLGLAEIGLVPLQPSEKNCKSLPIKVFEYMACGLPQLVARLPSTIPYIEQSGAGVIYDSTDAEAFAREARRMLADGAGREAVERMWNWAEMEKRMIEAYGRLERA